MITYTKFVGINNVATEDRLAKNELREAVNVDIGLDGEVLRRKGSTSLSAVAHKNVWQGDGFLLATRGVAGDLVNVDTDTVLHAAIGHDRVWYTNLPDGRTTYANGTVRGIVGVGGGVRRDWGVPVPAAGGTPLAIAGDLYAGDYQYWLTYRRTADGQESGAWFSAPITLPVDSGLSISGLPTLAGHTINVYLSSHNGAVPYLAGNTGTSMFAFAGANSDLIKPIMTGLMNPAPAGTINAFWRGRTLVAVDNVLFASRPHQWELFDLKRDFKHFSGDVTLIQPVDGGIFVGTEKELAFLAGTEFDKLVYSQAVLGRTVKGSGVMIDGELVKRGEASGMPRYGSDDAMICIADGVIVAGFSDGAIVRMTEDRYKTTATEVFATLRMRDRAPLYTAQVAA